MKKTGHLTITIFSIAFFLSCKKDKIPSNTYFGATGPPLKAITMQEMADMKYKPGTFWFFIDSVSLASDSLIVTKYYNGVILYPTYGFSSEFYRIFTKDYPGNNLDYYTLLPYNLSRGGDTVGYGLGSQLIYESRAVTGSSTVHIDSFYVYDRYYHNVGITTCPADPTENNHKTIYYINSQYGFLRKDIYDSGNNLISKKVLKNKLIVR